MDAKVIVAVPNWFTTDASATMTGYTYRLALKAINGVPQGPHLFSNKTNNLFRKLGLRQCRSEPCLFYHHDHHLFLIVWVGDLFLFFPTSSSHHAAKLWKGIQAELDLEDMADIDDCLACIVRRDRPNHKLTLTQESADIHKPHLQWLQAACTIIGPTRHPANLSEIPSYPFVPS